jgi:hypothetical protein
MSMIDLPRRPAILEVFLLADRRHRGILGIDGSDTRTLMRWVRVYALAATVPVGDGCKWLNRSASSSVTGLMVVVNIYASLL